MGHGRRNLTCSTLHLMHSMCCNSEFVQQSHQICKAPSPVYSHLSRNPGLKKTRPTAWYVANVYRHKSTGIRLSGNNTRLNPTVAGICGSCWIMPTAKCNLIDQKMKIDKMGTFGPSNKKLGKLQENMLWSAIFTQSFRRNYIL